MNKMNKMNKKSFVPLALSLAAVLIGGHTLPVRAQDTRNVLQSSTAKNPVSIGEEEKLKEVYKQYRIEDIPTLEQNHAVVGLGFDYTAGGEGFGGIEQNNRSFTTTAMVKYGLLPGVNISAFVPVTWAERKVESVTGLSNTESRFGVANPTLQILAGLPTKGFQTNLTAAFTPPVGSSKVSDDHWRSNLGFNLNRLLEPAFVYGGLGWQRDWGSRVNAVSYNLGASLFVNDKLAIGPDLRGIAIISGTNNVSGIGASILGSTVRERDSAIFSILASYRLSDTWGFNVRTSTGITQQPYRVGLGATVFHNF